MLEFNIGSSSLSFSAGQDAYRIIRQKYKNISRIIGKDIESRYGALIANPEQFMASLERVAGEYVNRITNTAICDLILYDIIDIDDAAFLAHYSESHLTWVSDVASVRQIYNDIVLDGELRSQNGLDAGVLGGGFGVEGAVKGIAIATAANAAIGVATGMINVASTGLKSISIKNRLVALINSVEAKTTIFNAVENLVFNAHYSLIDLIKEKCPDVCISVIGPREEKQSNAIVWNIKKGRVQIEQIENFLVRSIKLNPYSEASYRQWHLSKCTVGGDFTALLEYVSIELNDIEIPVEQMSETAVSATISELKVGFTEILSSFKSDDFYIRNLIPERKMKNAMDNYFNSSVFNSSTNELTLNSNNLEIGEMLALVDSTAFGSAEHGLAISTVGFGWKDSSTSGAIRWEELIAKGIVVDTGFFKITIGDKAFANTSAVKNNLLASLINELAGYYRSSKIGF